MKDFLWVAAMAMSISFGMRTYFESMPYQVRESVYEEAIKAGAAVRVVDRETGETSIQWRTCVKEMHDESERLHREDIQGFREVSDACNRLRAEMEAAQKEADNLRSRILEIASLLGDSGICCENLSHRYNQFHEASEDCPVAKRLHDLLTLPSKGDRT